MSWYWHPPHESSETNLQTLAWNISTLGGRLRMAGRRGENVVVPFREGRLWVPKVYEETELELLMWVIGAEEDGEIPDNPSDQFWENVKRLQRLFVTDRALGILSYDHPTLGQRVYAEAEIAEEIDFTSQAGATRAAFIVKFFIPKVWFRPAQAGGDAALTTRANGAEWSVNIDSDVPMKDPIVKIARVSGSPANIRLYNKSLSSASHWVMYRDVLGAGDEVEINAGTWRATLNGTTDVSNNLDWSGQPEFFELLPGRNDLKIEYTGGSVQVQVTAKGRYW